MKLAQLECLTTTRRQPRDDRQQPLELLVSRDSTVRTRLVTDEIQRLDFPQQLDRYHAAAPQILRQQMPYRGVEVSAAVEYAGQIRLPDARVGLLHYVVDLAPAEPAESRA